MEENELLRMCELREAIPYSTFYQEYLVKNQPCIFRCHTEPGVFDRNRIRAFLMWTSYSHCKSFLSLGQTNLKNFKNLKPAKKGSVPQRCAQ